MNALSQYSSRTLLYLATSSRTLPPVARRLFFVRRGGSSARGAPHQALRWHRRRGSSVARGIGGGGNKAGKIAGGAASGGEMRNQSYASARISNGVAIERGGKRKALRMRHGISWRSASRGSNRSIVARSGMARRINIGVIKRALAVSSAAPHGKMTLAAWRSARQRHGGVNGMYACI